LGWFHRRLLNELELHDAAQALTPREQQKMPLLLNRRLVKQIAYALGLTVSTTHFYVASI
jgi:DNA-binding NarL/FixJ family response regulator